ncbi:MAG: hypothetical protein ACI93D_000591 [Gammaproteobacteria bacterium]|jgi:hypothetical protein|tara:strand:- start:2298 stop:2741 length:444 start_codon:yes stop_codon:yes gene_type:complete
MKLKNTYLVFTLLFIPGYIFYIPVINYIYNFNKITYSLNIPENNIENNSVQITKYKDIEFSDDIPLKQIISESWVIAFPSITSEKLISNFSNNLKKIGITSIINLSSKKNTGSIAIGPFVDKQMAENIALKIKNSLNYSGNIERLNN